MRIAILFILAITPVQFALAYPKIRARTEPYYPVVALLLGQEGNVDIGIEIDADGQVTSTTVLRSSGFPVLDKSAIATISQWEFEPQRDESGKAIPTRTVAPFKFVLDGFAFDRINYDVEIPTLECPATVRLARYFQKRNPTANFTDMPLFQATKKYLAGAGIGPNLITPSAYNRALVKCIEGYKARFIDLIKTEFPDAEAAQK